MSQPDETRELPAAESAPAEATAANPAADSASVLTPGPEIGKISGPEKLAGIAPVWLAVAAAVAFILAWLVLDWIQGPVRRPVRPAAPGEFREFPLRDAPPVPRDAGSRPVPAPPAAKEVYGFVRPGPDGQRYLGCFESSRPQAEVRAYYETTMPQLGWVAAKELGEGVERQTGQGSLAYRKDKQRALINFFPSRTGSGSDFMLSVQPGGK